MVAAQPVQLATGPTVILPKPPANLEDFTGRWFGSLVVLGYGGCRHFTYGPRHFWVVKCFCGHVWKVQTGALRHGGTRHCANCKGRRGIRRRKKPWKTRNSTRFHGGSDTPEYKTWHGMCQRCYNPLNSGYPNYGARGIRVCRRWRLSFKNFLDDMGPRPSPELSIDRIDNNGPYSPENCRWATREQQEGNKRHRRGPRRIFTIGGKTQCMSAWARDIGITNERVRQRLLKYPPEVALTMPKG